MSDISASRPIAATLAVVVRGEQVLLVRRANPPDAGLWGFPGGKIEVGETIEIAAVRELYEETAVQGEAQRVFTAVDAMDRDEQGGIRRHFILIVVLCRWISGEPVAGDDALEAAWFDLATLDRVDLGMSFGVQSIAQQAQALAAAGVGLELNRE